MPQIMLTLTEGMIERIERIKQENDIFENNYDVILHAITDLLEKYR